MLNPVHRGDEVFWTDPDEGISSGIYIVIQTPDEEKCNQKASAMDILVLRNDAGSISEVFRHELS